MNCKINHESKQAAMLVFAAFLTDCFIQPFGLVTEILPARTMILASAVQFGLLCAFYVLYVRLSRGSPAGRLRSVLLCSALVLSIALEVIQAERFYNYVMQQQLQAALFLALVFAAAYYGTFAGIQALARAAWPVLVLAALSVFVLGWSVSDQLMFSHLQTPAFEVQTLTAQTLARFYLPPELVILPLLCRDDCSVRGGIRLIGAVFLVNSVLTLLGEMTLGAAYVNGSQPVFTIARLGGLSVFRRLDALHVGVWLLLFLIKISLYFAAFVSFWPQRRLCKGHGPYWIALTAVMVAFLMVWNQNEAAARLTQQLLLVAAIASSLVSGFIIKKGEKP